MATAYWSSVFTSSADAIWAVVRRFNGLPDWHPAIRASEIIGGGDGLTPGAVRLLTGADGSTYRERLVGLDDAERKLSYEIVEAPLPVRGYRSTLHVRPVADTGGAFLSWHATFEPAEGTTAQEATTVLEAAYAPAIAGLHTVIA
ncbi:Polyketide cyclase / dehydrase and lipid transport [Streptomyces sp. Ag82_O1-12]|uniref:SRPBCC family protein n=1 Tax=unclassified Streptomyces TaxID=2593676 RepID=UPI000BD4AB02|nr:MULTISPECIES: SRPBCC family protein [unclassified Streptomyces]SMQ20494.1 Polyketide cyclase / dehydrase and lipid transport [Streptomyces sp. Ag82_O1-12]SOD49324.1 Polyketide cyclase / dehydrase and lipid transport [Streptomyces sp. Ag82_G6-1]